MDKLKRKLNARAGETIVEVLVAVLILSVAFVILAGSVMAAARINDKAKNDAVEFSTASTHTDAAVSLSFVIPGSSTEPVAYTVEQIESSKGYYYYEKATRTTITTPDDTPGDG